MSGIAPQGQKRVGSPLFSGRDSPAPGMGTQDERCDAFNPQPHDQPAPPVQAQPSPRLMIPESARFTVQALQTAVECGADLFLPLRDALWIIPEIRDLLEKNYNIEVGFDALKRGLATYRVIANAYASTDSTLSDDIQKHLSAIATIIQQLWRIVDDESDQEPRDQPTQHVQSSENAKVLFERLTSLLEIFEFADNAAVEDHLVVLNQLLSPHSSAVERDHRAVVMFNRNGNTNYNSGSGNIVNNNSVSSLVTNFIFSGSNAPTTPDLAQKQKKALNDIKSILGDRFVHDAVYDTQPKDAGCMPGTRETILAKLIVWATEGLMKIFWLAGMAGTGKTSIAVTLCHMLEDEGSVILGGSFFCSRTTGSVARTEVRRILPSLAALLAAQVPEFAVALASELKADDRIAHKTVSDQIITLLQKPLAALVQSPVPIIFVIDALDECSNARELAELLAAIADFASDVKIKFILTSRPEMHIRGTPISNPKHNEVLHLHTISEEEVTADIRHFISSTLQDVPSDTNWYTANDVDQLVRLSHGLFIFASTVLNYVIVREQVKGRKDRLRKATSTAGGGSAATSSLDKIYEMIVHEASRSDQVDEDELRLTQRVIASILAARTSLSVQALADLLGLDIDDLRGSLEHLHSVVHVPTDDAAVGVRVLHASFGDYIVSRAAKDVRIDSSLGDRTLAQGCLHVMANHLHFNISQSCSSYEPNSATRPGCIVLSVQYACLQWIYHVYHLPNPSVLDDEINKIFRPNLLFWIEVVSVLGRVGRAAAMLHIATSTVQLAELSHFLRDARTFIASSREAIEKSAPHIYISALPFASKHSLIYKTFAPLYTGIISVETLGIDRHGGRLVMTLTGHEGRVNLIAYSADSRLLASGGSDDKVRIWDMRTSEEIVSPLCRGHGNISSVAFAYSGRRIASGHSLSNWRGTSAEIVCIWNIGTEQMIPERLLGHYCRVSSVAFSSDDSVLASASRDGTVRLWRLDTGENTALLYGHNSKVNALAFSPNGKILASCCDDNIRLWEVVTGKPAGKPLRGGHSTRCLSFSPDGTKIAAGLHRRIYLWELSTRRNIATLGGYYDQVSSVRFSSDGSSLMSAECNGTICLRRLQPDSVVILSKGSDPSRSGSSHLAMLSPNGLYIASGSASGTIQILDAGDNQVTAHASQTHEIGVTSVAVSHNGAIIVSGSEDGTVRVWDAQTGEQRLPPLLWHTGPVISVAVSLDGRFIASISATYDHSARLWDARTGEAVGDALYWQSQLPSGGSSALVFSSDARFFATGWHCKTAEAEEVLGVGALHRLPRYDCSVNVFEISTGKPLIIGPLRCESFIQGIAFSWDDTMLAAVTSEGWIHLWNLNTKQSVWEPLRVYRNVTWSNWLFFSDQMTEGDQRRAAGLHCIGFSPDALHIVSGGKDGIYVWNIGTRQLVLDLKHPAECANSVAFSPCGRHIVSGTNSSSYAYQFRPGTDHGTIRLWNASTGTPVATMRGHGHWVQSVVFTPDAQSIVSCSNDSTIRVWNIAAAFSLSSTDAYNPIVALSSIGIGEKGWVLGPLGELLLWVPEEYRDFIQVPPCTLLGRHRIVITDNDNRLQAGENWTACWRANV